MSDNIFRILAVIIFVSGAAISGYYRRKADREGGKVSLKDEGLIIAINLRLFGLSLWAGVFAWLINPAWMNWSRFDLPEWVRWLGLLLGVLANGTALMLTNVTGVEEFPIVAGSFVIYPNPANERPSG